MKACATAAEREARVAAILARAAALQQSEEDRREAMVARLWKTVEQTEQAEQARRRGMEIKGPWAGTSRVVLCRLGVGDRQGDVLDPGLLLNAPDDRIPVSSWPHALMHDPSAMPVGRARLWQEGTEILADVVYDPTPEGKIAAARVAQEKPDWSFGYHDVQTRPLTADERAQGATRAIHKFLVVEISAVDKGASIGQGTTHTCLGAECPVDGKSTCDCTVCALTTCPRHGGFPPLAPRRQAQEARAAALVAKQAALDADAEQRRERRVAALVAQERAFDAAEAAEALRVAIAEDDRHRRVTMICLRAGLPLPEPWSAVLGHAPRYAWEA